MFYAGNSYFVILINMPVMLFASNLPFTNLSFIFLFSGKLTSPLHRCKVKYVVDKYS